MEQLTTDKSAMRAKIPLHGNAHTTSIKGQLENGDDELQIARSCVWHDHVQGAAVLEEEALERVWGKEVAEIANIFNKMKMTELLIAIKKNRKEVGDE